MLIKKSDVKNLVKSFTYALKGIAYCLKNERNMRIHVCMTVLVSLFSYFFKVTQTEFLILFLCIGFVISSEMVNTAMETLVNLESPSYNNLAKIAKDVAAGAVFIAALVAVVTGCFIFIKPQRLMETLHLIFTSPVALISFAAALLLSILFIFNGPGLYGEKTTRVYHMKPKSNQTNKENK